MSMIIDGTNGLTFNNATTLTKLTALGLTQAEVTALIG